MNKLKYVQLHKDDAAQFEAAKRLWIPFCQELNQHDGVTETEGEIITDLKRRIAIQGKRADMQFELVYLGEEPVGIAMFAIDLGTVYGLLEKGYGTTMGFYIRPEYRGKGYGRQLWEHAEAVLRGDGATKFYVCPDMVTGIPFWEKMGFSDSGKIDPDDKKPIYTK